MSEPPQAKCVYEDNFGYWDIDPDDEEELSFFIYVKAVSRPRKCIRCKRRVRLQPGRETCARCVEAMEYGADRDN